MNNTAKEGQRPSFAVLFRFWFVDLFGIEFDRRKRRHAPEPPPDSWGKALSGLLIYLLFLVSDF